MPVYAVDVPVPSIFILENLYQACCDDRIPRDIRLALFCNIHAPNAIIDFPHASERSWTFPKAPPPFGDEAPAGVFDDDYAARAIHLYIFEAATHVLYNPPDHPDATPMPDRYSLRTLKDNYVPRTAHEAEILKTPMPNVLPLSHSKDQPLIRLPNHECVLALSELPVSLAHAREWSPRTSDREIYSDSAFFLGRYLPTKTLGKCRWCLYGSGWADNDMVSLSGCSCEDAVTLGLSHEQCLFALAEHAIASHKLCCACLHEHQTKLMTEDSKKLLVRILKDIPAKETMVNTWNTVPVYMPVCTGLPPCTGDQCGTCPKVTCAVCGITDKHMYIWLYIGRPVFLRFDFCCKEHLDMFETSCKCSMIVNIANVAVYKSDDALPMRRLASPFAFTTSPSSDSSKTRLRSAGGGHKH
jgi:hypothetical protein